MRWLFLLIPLVVPACTTTPAGRGPMTIAECEVSSYCVIEGVASIAEVDHVQMGRLDVGEGRCVSLSLSERDLEAIRRRGPERRTFRGQVFPANPSNDFSMLRVNGRRVGLTQCGNFYLFVE